MSLKTIYQLRRYIATQAFMQWIVVNIIATIAGKPVWSYPIYSFLDVLCAVVCYIIYRYHDENLKFDVIVDDEYIIESRYVYYQCVILGGLWLLIVLLYSYFTKQSSVAFIFISLFLVAPLFWLKLYYHLLVFVWSHIFRIFFDISTIHKMYKDNEKGELSVMDGVLRFQFMQAVDECFDADFDLGITVEDLKSVGSKFSKRVDTHGHTQEFIKELKAKNANTENWAFIIRVVFPFLFLLFGIFNTLYGGVAGAVNSVFESRDIARYESNVHSVNITESRNSIDWKDLTGDDIIFYDDQTLALDKTNGVIFGLFRYSQKKGDTVYYHWLYLKYPEQKALMVYCRDDGIALKDSPVNYFDSFGEQRNLITIYYDLLMRKMKINNNAEADSNIDLREYHRLKFENKSIPTKQRDSTSNSKYNDKGNMASDSIILKTGNGNTQRLERADEAVIVRNMPIQIYSTGNIKDLGLITIPTDYDLSKCVVSVLNSRILKHNGTATLADSIEFQRTDYDTMKTEKIRFPKGTQMTVNVKWPEGNYTCYIWSNQKRYTALVDESLIVPTEKQYWYDVIDFPLIKENRTIRVWIEGKNLTPIVKREKKKANRNNNFGIME